MPDRPRRRLHGPSHVHYDAVACREGNLVERLWGGLKDWQRIATRYDKLARNYLAVAFIAAIIIYWIN